MSFLHLPLTINEGIYSSIAQKLAHGGLLYKDVWDHKPPFIFWAYQLAATLSPDVELQAHGLALLAHLATAFLIYMIAQRTVRNARASWLAGCFYCVLILPVLFQPWSGQADLLMQPLLLLCVLLALSRGWAAWFLAGISWASAFFFKQTALFYLPVLVYLSWGDALTLLTDFFWGVNALSALVIAPFALSGRLGLFWQAVMGINGSYLEGGWSSFLQNPVYQMRTTDLLGNAGHVYGLSVVAVLGLYLGARRGKSEKDQPVRFYWAPLLFWACSLAACMASGAFYSYYFVAALPGLAWMSSWGLAKLSARRGWGVGVFLAMLVLPELVAADRYCAHPENELEKAGYSLVRMEAARDIGGYLRKNALPTDTLVAWVSEPQIYSYAGISSEYVRTPLVAHLQLLPDEEKNFESKLLSNPPTWLVVEKGLSTPDLPEYMLTLLASRYRKLAEVGTKQLYRRN